MSRASHKKLAEFSAAILDLYRNVSLETLGPDFTHVMNALVPSLFCALNWLEDGHVPRVHWDRGAPSPEQLEAFDCHVGDHPLMFFPEAYARTRDPVYTIGRWSDFLSLRQFKETGLHREFFSQLETNHQLGVLCPNSDGAPTLALSFQRDRRDFSDEEVLLMRIAGPHFEQAYSQAVLRSKIEKVIAAQHLALEGIAAMIVSAKTGSILHCSTSARRLCEWHFAGESPASAARSILQKMNIEGTKRFTRTTGEEQLVVKCLGPVRREGASEAVWMLEFAERSLRPDPSALKALGLTPREAEVLSWVCEGKTNDEIAIILGAKPGTVRKHVENIHRKLGVENRASAAAMVRNFLP